MTVLVQDPGAGDEPKGDLASLGLVEPGQIAGIELDLPVAERKAVAGNDAIDRPRLGAQESGSGRKLQPERVDLTVRPVFDAYAPKDGDGVLVGSIGEAGCNIGKDLR